MKVLVAYIDVGDGPKEKVTENMNEWATKLQKKIHDIGSDIRVLALPVRNQPTKLEVLELD